MKRFLRVALMSFGMVLMSHGTVYGEKKPKPDLFEVLYYQHVDRTNATLGDFMAVSCTEQDSLSKDAAILSSNVDKMVDLVSKIPDTQPLATQVKELETGYGVLFMIHKLVDSKSQQCASPTSNGPNTNGD